MPSPRKEGPSPPTSESASLMAVKDVSTDKPKFPEKLHSVLNMPEFCNIITWLPSGKSFCIVDRDAFTKIVLPRFFKQAKFKSFWRRYVRVPGVWWHEVWDNSPIMFVEKMHW